MGLHVLVLAGGSGTRLWPLSRVAVPKHLLPLGPGGRTLLRAAVERVRPLGATVWVVTTADQAPRCAEELAAAGADPSRVVAEPTARGTGPALGLAVARVAREDPDAVVCSVHADAHIGDDAAYRTALFTAAGWALGTRGLVTVGLTPAFASPAVGYIALGEELDMASWVAPLDAPPPGADAGSPRPPAFAAEGFVEKPSVAVAAGFLKGGRHLWNLGLFAWTAPVFLAELRAASAVVATGVERVLDAQAEGDTEGAAAAYLALPNEPVDTLVMERTARLTVVRAAFPWSDLGSWADLRQARAGAGDADDRGNVIGGDALVLDSTDCLVDARGGRLVCVVGGENLVVVDTGDAVLVLSAGDSQRVKDVVARLRQAGRTEIL